MSPEPKATIKPATFNAWGCEAFAVNTNADPEAITGAAYMLMATAERLANYGSDGEIKRTDALLLIQFISGAAKACIRAIGCQP